MSIAPGDGAGPLPGPRRRSCAAVVPSPSPSGAAGPPQAGTSIFRPPTGSVASTWSQRSASSPEARATRRFAPRLARTSNAAPVCSAREISAQKSPSRSQTVTGLTQQRYVIRHRLFRIILACLSFQRVGGSLFSGKISWADLGGNTPVSLSCSPGVLAASSWRVSRRDSSSRWCSS